MQAREPRVLSRIFRSSGCVLQQGCTLPVLAALAAEEPETVARAHAFVSLKDNLRAWLTGRIGADRTEAAVAPGNASTRDRSPLMITAFGLDGLAHLLPPAEESHAVGGTVTAAAAATTGLRVGIPVAVGAGDVPCTVLGAGGARPGLAIVILGTTAMVGVTHSAPLFTPPDLGLLFTLPGTCWFRAMVNVAGTLNLDWALKILAPELTGGNAMAAFEMLARQSPPGANGVVYLPYLSDSGIIAPTVDPTARAGFGGLAPRHTRADMARAVYEGVALSLTELLELTGFSGDAITLVGGGARSGLWPKMIADLCGKPVTLRAGHEFGARGAALLARVALGDLRDMAEAAAMVPPERLRLEPDPALADVASLARSRYLAFRGDA